MLQLLDTTLRDGSYVVNFQFTARDTAQIAAKLDAAGVHYIEVGHGLGMGAGGHPDMRSPESDEAYLLAASSVVKRAKWGMFFIPSIGSLREIELAARHGMSFIRVGINVNEADQAEAAVRLARELGMEVFVNFMKTYALPPAEVAVLAAQAAKFGAHHVCVVDSAGGMLAEEVSAYVSAIRDKCDVSVGFHGHNNLGMAISNSIAAIDAGASIVDTSVRGMGRSSGNAVTEILVLALKRKGHELNIDVTAVLDLAEKIIDPLLRNYQQVDSIGIISGYAQFHSSFLGKIMRFAERYRIDPRELIVRLTRVDRIGAPDALLDQLSSQLAAEREGSVARVEVELPVVPAALGDTSMGARATAIAEQAANLGRRWTRESVFNVVQTVRTREVGHVSSVTYEGHQYVVASGEVVSADEAFVIAKAVDGKVDYVLLDIDRKSANSASIVAAVSRGLKNSKLLYYSDTDVWARAAVQLVAEYRGRLARPEIVVVGATQLAATVLAQLQLRYDDVSGWVPGKVALESAGMIIICSPVEDADLSSLFSVAGMIVVDAWVGSLKQEHLSTLLAARATLVRPEMHQLIQAEIQSAIAVRHLVAERQGACTIEGIGIASGGFLAQAGTIIVDNFTRPAKVYGVADGRGFLKPVALLSAADRTSMDRIEKYILTSSVN